MRLSIIAAMARNHVIGKNGKMPWRLPAELQYFKRMTMGKPIVMGRKTFEAIGRVLPGRQNIVLTRERDYQHPGVDVVYSIDEAIGAAADAQELMIIGGAQLYRQTLGRADRLYLTLIDAEIEGDTHFPEFNQDDWEAVEKTARPADEKNEYSLTFLVLHRKTRSLEHSDTIGRCRYRAMGPR